MKRRDFMVLAGAAAAFPRIALAQQAPARVPRVVVLGNSVGNSALTDIARQAITQGLADFGLVAGMNVALDIIFAPTIDEVPAYAAQVVGQQPDLIWTLQSPPLLAVKALTASIPVVFTNLQDPVAIGVISSYARPAGNMTGNMLGGHELARKMVQFVTEVLPGMKRLALLGLPSDPSYPPLLMQHLDAIKALGLDAVLFETREGDDFAPLFDRVAQGGGVQAILAMQVGYFVANAARLTELAIERRLPICGGSATAARAGFLLSYSANNAAVMRRSASYVSAILKGAKPADLPVEFPTEFELALNQKTAKALGITFPSTVLLQATEIIS